MFFSGLMSDSLYVIAKLGTVEIGSALTAER
jgi:hypothetical protein